MQQTRRKEAEALGFWVLLNPPDVMHLKNWPQELVLFLLFTDVLQCLETTTSAVLRFVEALPRLSVWPKGGKGFITESWKPLPLFTRWVGY